MVFIKDHGLEPEGLPNPYLAWESTNKLQVGVDFGFFKDRIICRISPIMRAIGRLISYWNIDYRPLQVKMELYKTFQRQF